MPSRISSFVRCLGHFAVIGLSVTSIGLTVFGQRADSPKIEITEPVIKEAQDAVKIAFKVTGASKKRIRVKVDCGVDAVTSTEIKFTSDGEHVINVNLFKGANNITLIGFVNDEPSSTLMSPISVHCTGRWCKEPFGLSAETVASEYRETAAGPAPAPTATPTPQQQGGGGGGQAPTGTSNFKIRPLTSGTDPVNTTKVQPTIVVQSKSGTTKLSIDVYNNGQRIDHKDGIKIDSVPETQIGLGTTDVKIATGKNEIRVYDPLHLNDKAFEDLAVVTCTGDKCKAADAAAGSADTTETTAKITIEEPKTKQGEAYEVEDKTSIDSWVTVAKGISQIQYDVITSGRDEIFRSPVTPVDTSKDKAKIPLRLKFLEGTNTIRIYDVAHAGESDTSIVIKCKGKKCATDFEELITHSTPFTRGIVGLEQAAAASANPEQKLFLEFNLTAPLFRKGKSPLEAPLWLWLNPRITSLPTQVSSSVAEFSTASNFFSPFTAGKVNDIVQGFEFTGGFEVPIRLSGRGNVTGPIASGFGPKTKVRFGVSALLGAGVQAPFSSQKTVQVFKVNDSVKERFPEVGTNTQIAFVSGDRTRFFRQYFAGLRLKTYYVNGEEGQEDNLDNIFPGILDVTFGQNESVTRACLCGVVTHIEGIFPLPFIKGDKRGSVYVFGSASLKLNDAQVLKPIFLEPVIPQPAVPGAGIFIQQVPFEDRDHYRLGLGVDLIRLLKRN